MVGFRSRAALFPVFLGVFPFLAGCAGNPAEGRWVGRVTPEAGSAPALGCQGPGRSVLIVQGSRAMFTPDDGVAVLVGEIDAAGKIRTSRTTTGADKKPFALIFEGRLEGGKISGTYAAPRCRAAVELQPA